jgi:RHS repeat-associated protein
MKTRSVLLAVLLAAGVMPAFADCPVGASWCSGLYRYDGMGNIRAIGSDTYIYDTTGRLVSGTAENQRGGTSRQDYGYDTFGNRTSASRIPGSVDCLGGCEQSPTIDPTTNHITGNSAVYDAAGNLISIVNTVNSTPYTATYVYDSAGSMARATAGSDDRQFIYTADDERIATRNGQSWTWTVRGLDSKVLREFTSLEPNGSPGLPTTTRLWSKDYLWRDGLLLASVSATSGSNITEHFHLDHLGTPRLVSNDAGVQIGIHAYYPFGAELNLSPETPIELMKFTGHERDLLASNPNSLDYMHARYYNPTAARFLSVDPAGWDNGLPQSFNRYSYALNNPIRYTDPDGRCTDPVTCVAEGLAVPVAGMVLIDAAVVAGVVFSVGSVTLHLHPDPVVIPAALVNPTYAAEHVKGARPSTENKHQQGEARKAQDRGKEKGDERRRPPRKRPPDWRGPWPPKVVPAPVPEPKRENPPPPPPPPPKTQEKDPEPKSNNILRDGANNE